MLKIAPWSNRGDAQDESWPALSVAGSVERVVIIEDQDRVALFTPGNSCEAPPTTGRIPLFKPPFTVAANRDAMQIVDYISTGPEIVERVGSRSVVCRSPFTVQLEDGQRFGQFLVFRITLSRRWAIVWS